MVGKSLETAFNGGFGHEPPRGRRLVPPKARCRDKSNGEVSAEIGGDGAPLMHNEVLVKE